MFWLCLVLSCALTSFQMNAEEDAPLSLTNMTEQPIPRVHGTVNVISGDWIDQEVLNSPSGPDSFAIGHSYSSSNDNEGTLSDAWDFLWPSVLEYSHYGETNTVIMHEEGGAKLAYESYEKKTTPLFTINGYTHISTIDHPATRDPARITLLHQYSANPTIILSDGTKRVFEPRKIQDHHLPFHDDLLSRFYNLIKEILPSKNVRHFSYDKKGNLSSIRTVSSCGNYLIQNITLRTTPHTIYAKSLDGQEVEFQIEKDHHAHSNFYSKRHPKQLIHAIKRPGVPSRTYSYLDDKAYSHTRIEKRKWTTGLTEEAKYYKGSETKINGKKVHVPKDDKDFTYRRVSEVRTKRFRGEEPFMKHGFFYDKKDTEGDYRILRAEDADNSSIAYMWNAENRIIWTSYYNKKDRKIGQEYFVWSKEFQQHGRLLQRTVYDEDRNPLLIRKWNFTKEGFAKEEKWHGLFTRHDAPELTAKERTKPKGGETITLSATWDEHGNQLSKTDALGNVVESEYDRCFVSARYYYHKHDQIIGREFYTYDTAGCLIQSIKDDGCQKGVNNLEHVRRRTITTTIPRRQAPRFGAPEQITHSVWTPDSKEQVLYVEYFQRDAKGRVLVERKESPDGLKSSTSYCYDAVDRLIETTYPDGSYEKITYDPVSEQILEKTYPHKRILYTYDLFSRIISEKETYSDGSFFETTTDYDQAGRVVTVRDSQGNKTVTEKDILGRIVSKTMPEVMTPSGKVAPIEKRKYKGRSVYITSPTGAVTETVYSSLGKPLLTRHPEGYCSIYTYDLAGRLLESTDGTRTNKTFYNHRGNVKRTETWAGGQLINWQENRYSGEDLIETETELLLTKIQYDAFGRCSSQQTIDKTTKKEWTETTAYDGFGRPIRKESADVIQLTTYDCMGRVVETKNTTFQGTLLLQSKNAYDLAGRVIESAVRQNENSWLITKTNYGAYGLISSTIAPDGSTTHFLYQKKDNAWIKKTVDPRGITVEEVLMGSTAALSSTVTDPMGTVLSSQRTFVNLLGLPTRTEYDIYYQGKKEETLVTLLEYDHVGRRIRVREAAGTNEEVSSYKSYDCYGRCVEETLPSGIRLSSSFDAKGRLVHKTSSDGSINQAFTYTYHDCIATAKDLISNTTTTRTYDGFKHIVTEEQSNGLALTYSYNSYGLLESVTLPDNSSIQYSFSGGMLTSVTRTNKTDSYTFEVTKRNDAGAILETVLPLNGGTVQYTYDAMGHVLTKQQLQAPESRVYDLIGRVASRTIAGVKEEYRYDDLSQLISDNGRERAYDSLYRMRKKEGETTEVTRRQQITKLGSKQFSYDLDGHRVADGTASLTYDALGRLLSYKKNGSIEQYTYDALSRRMTISSNGTLERYLWLGQHEIGTYSGTNEAISFRLLAEGVGSEGGSTIAVELNNTPYVCYSDLSGNIRLLVSDRGEEVHSASYSAFSRTSTTGLDCPWGFFSKRHDALSGYVVFLYRLYDPETSSWITQDPLGLEGGPNLYAYVKSNPLSRFDALGLFDLGDVWDSCCSFVSDCYHSVCDACSSVYDACSSACSSICSSLGSAWDSCSSAVSGACSSVSSWCSSTCHNIASTLSSLSISPAANAPAVKTEYKLQNGTTVTPNTKAPAGLYIYPYGTWKEFKKAAKENPQLLQQVCFPMMGVGMTTPLFTGCERVDAFLSGQSTFQYAPLGYNPKSDFLEAATRASINALGIRTDVVNTLQEDLMDFFDEMTTAGRAEGWEMHCHSHFGAIFDCILHTKAFDENNPNSYRHHLRNIYTYGSATLIPSATNFIAVFDPIPFLNPRNWAIMASHPECVRFTDFVLQSPLSAHGFDNYSYQTAFKSVIHSK